MPSEGAEPDPNPARPRGGGVSVQLPTQVTQRCRHSSFHAAGSACEAALPASDSVPEEGK